MAHAYRALAAGGWWLRSGDPLSITLDALALVTLVAGAACLLALLRPARGRAMATTPSEHRRAAAIVSAPRVATRSRRSRCARTRRSSSRTAACSPTARCARPRSCPATRSGRPGSAPGDPRRLPGLRRGAAAGTWSSRRLASAHLDRLPARSACARCEIGTEAVVDPPRLHARGAGDPQACARRSTGSSATAGRIELVSGGERPGRDAGASSAPWSAPGAPAAASVRLRDDASDRLWGAHEDEGDRVRARARARGRAARVPALTSPTAAASRSTRCAGSATSPTGSTRRWSPRALEYARERGCREV